ncbi:MAG: ABC transporter substrate-binding protein [Litorilinea sp.]
MQQLRRWMILPLALVAVMILAACGGGSGQEPAPPSGDTDTPAAEEQPAGEEPAAAPGGSSANDEYLAAREACTWDNRCWPEIIDTIPESFNEAPMLAEMVANGDLPPVEERLPAEPLVIEPAEMIGEYSGTLRRAFTGPGDRQNGERWVNDYTIFWDPSGTVVVPRLAKDWESNEDASEWTFYLREGSRWSDGEPFTADDYMFWYEHILLNEDLTTAVPSYLNWGGDLAVMEKIDDYAFKITFAAPFPSWPTQMASSNVGGHLHKGQAGGNGGNLYAPAHYLEQFHPDFIGQEEADRLSTEAEYESWNLHFLFRNDPQMNMEVPVMSPWKPISRIASDEYTLERNPYFIGVDSAGNQLPYYDRISMELVEELEVLNLRAIAGNYTIQGRHINFGSLPVIRENEEAGNYFVDFWSSTTRHPVKVAFSVDWNEDPEIAEYTVGSLDFRKALSLAIEREEINETFFLGVGRPASFCPAGVLPYFNSDRWDEEFGRFDPEEANALLDSIGLEERDSEGYRLLPSGDRLVLRADAVSGSFLDYPAIGERISQMWRENVGVQLQINPVERSLWIERNQANQSMMNIFETGEFNPAVVDRLIPSERWGPVADVWGATPNPDPADYDGPQWVKDMVAKHWEAMQEPDPDRALELFIEGTEIMCDNSARIGIVVDIPVYTTLIKKNVRNVTKPMEWIVYSQTPGNGMPEQFFEVSE